MHNTRDYTVSDLAELSSASRPTGYRILGRRPAATSPGKSALGSHANVMSRSNSHVLPSHQTSTCWTDGRVSENSNPDGFPE
jgi:hypothetical protein